jgi:soluble lytic murein transglycosylase
MLMSAKTPAAGRVVRASCLFATLLLAAHAWAQSDADVLRAKDAFDRGDRARLAALAPALEGHVLEPYVMYWQLTLGLDEADPEQVRRFLAREAGSPLADRLRVEWLKSLGKRGAWADFEHDYTGIGGDDLELSCYLWQDRLRGEEKRVPDDARAAWFTGASTPDACQPLFDALLARGTLSEADRRARMRLAIEAGNLRLAHALGEDLHGRGHISVREFQKVDRNPAAALARGRFDWKTASGRDLALYALERGARKDAGAVRAAWARWRMRLPAADRAYGNRRLAYHAARQLEPEANAWFHEAGAPSGSVDELGWRIRAALRASDWPDVAAAIAALPDAQQQEPQWRYWKARALAATGSRAQANELFAALSQDVGFYGLLAAEAQGLGAQQLAGLKSEPLVVDGARLAAFGSRADVQRVIKLLSLDLRLAAIREWAYIVRNQSDENLLVAAEYARRAGLYDRAINAAERTATRQNFRMRYLTPWQPAFSAAARDQGVDEALLYGIARQESRFVPDIVSSGGAVGLMQLMPRTARWVAGKLARNDFTPSTIAGVELNTQFGAFYFRYWHDRLGERPALTAAAYNAGPSRAQAWRPPSAALEGAIWVETIPFSETRDYVKKVLANTVLYAHALGLPYVSLTKRLGVITPRGSDSSALASGSP